jgi:hypothetical protein
MPPTPTPTLLISLLKTRSSYLLLQFSSVFIIFLCEASLALAPFSRNFAFGGQKTIKKIIDLFMI